MIKGEQTLGSLDEHLTLQTKGKIKIRYGKKVIDLLDNDGELAISSKLQTQIEEILKEIELLKQK